MVWTSEAVVIVPVAAVTSNVLEPCPMKQTRHRWSPQNKPASAPDLYVSFDSCRIPVHIACGTCAAIALCQWLSMPGLTGAAAAIVPPGADICNVSPAHPVACRYAPGIEDSPFLPLDPMSMNPIGIMCLRSQPSRHVRCKSEGTWRWLSCRQIDVLHPACNAWSMGRHALLCAPRQANGYPPA